MREAVSSVLKKRVVKSAEERRGEILEAAKRLFIEKGFAETTVEEIAAAAGVAKGTVYLYFPKPAHEHILLALKRQFSQGLAASCADVIADAIERLGRGEGVERREVLDDILDAIVDYNLQQREAIEIVVRQAPNPDLVREALELEKDYLQLIANAFREATEYGLIHISDPEMGAYLVNAAIRDNIVTCICYGEPGDLDRLVAAAKELLYKALAPA